MAEKYGTVPPKFTRAWWEYFWYYYKWRVIITAAALVIAAVTIVQCATQEKYDMDVVYAGHMNYSDAETEKMEELLAGMISDIDGNGEKSVFFQQLVFLDNTGSAEYDYAIQTKLDVSFTDDCSFVYLLDREQAQAQLQKKAADELFNPADEWAGDTEAEVLTAEDGTAYAVSIEQSSLLKENDIYCDDMFVMVRQNYKEDEKNTLAHEDSLKIANALVK